MNFLCFLSANEAWVWGKKGENCNKVCESWGGKCDFSGVELPTTVSKLQDVDDGKCKTELVQTQGCADYLPIHVPNSGTCYTWNAKPAHSGCYEGSLPKCSSKSKSAKRFERLCHCRKGKSNGSVIRFFKI